MNGPKTNDPQTLFFDIYQRLSQLSDWPSNSLEQVRSELNRHRLHIAAARQRPWIEGLCRMLESGQSGGLTSESPRWFCLRREMQQIRDLLNPAALQRGIRMEGEMPAATQVFAPKKSIQVVLASLLADNLVHTPPDGDVSLFSLAENDGYCLEFADSSPRFFERPRTGSGRSDSISLAARLAQELSRRDGIQFCTLNCPQGGLAYSIHLPLNTASATGEPRRQRVA